MPSACRLKSLLVRNILINQYVATQLYAKLCNIPQPATCTTQCQLYKLLHKSGPTSACLRPITPPREPPSELPGEPPRGTSADAQDCASEGRVA